MAFDFRTEIRDEKTGKIIKTQPYIRHVSREHGEVYERDGKFFSGDGVQLNIDSWPPKAKENLPPRQNRP